MAEVNQPTILIVGPSTVTGQMLKRKLQKLGCEVHCAHIHSNAADAALQVQPDVILLDLSFEEPTGFELCEKIKGNKTLRKIPIVIHTNRSTRGNVIRVIRAGASSVIVNKIHELFGRLGRTEMVVPQVNAVATRGGGGNAGSPGGPSAAKQSQAVMFTEGSDAKERFGVVAKEREEDQGHTSWCDPDATGIGGRTQWCGRACQSHRIGHRDQHDGVQSRQFRFLRGQETHTSVKDAIVRIGFGEARNMVLGSSMLKNFRNQADSLGFHREGFWEHSLAVGSIAKKLVHQSRTVDPNLVFIVGLTYDVGKLIFDEYMSDNYGTALEASG